jgi:flavin reductase (DIM6/NTAB) family NADH-FMN oxidoreductase RutF
VTEKQLQVKKKLQPPEYWDRLFAPSSCLAMISTVDAQGRPNIGSFGTCTRVCHDPTYIAFTSGSGKDTTKNILQTGEFVVNLPAFERGILEKVLVAGIPFDPGVNEFEKAGLTPLPASIVKAPLIAECPRHFECRVEWTKEWSGRVMIVGLAVAAWVNDDCVDDQGFVIWEKVKPAHYSGASYDSEFVPAWQSEAFETPYQGPELIKYSGGNRSAAELQARAQRAKSA